LSFRLGKNLADGRVEAIFEGNKEAVENGGVCGVLANCFRIAINAKKSWLHAAFRRLADCWSAA